MNDSGRASETNVAGIVTALFVSMRPRQWYKNLIIYLAFFFTIDEAWSPSADIGAALSTFGVVTLAFLIFSALTGAVYLFNDTQDVDRDRLHPKKRFRPITSGRLPLSVARWACSVLIFSTWVAAFALNPFFFAIVCLYTVLMLAYSLFIKHIALVDAFAIGMGFVMRAAAGAVILLVPISPWLYLSTGLAALLLAFAKRRGEIVNTGESAVQQRKSLGEYTIHVLDQLITIVSTGLLIAYCLYTFSAPNLPQNNAMMLTIPFVVFGLFRYLHLVNTENAGEDAEEVFMQDKPLIASVVLWMLCAVGVLAYFRL